MTPYQRTKRHMSEGECRYGYTGRSRSSPIADALFAVLLGIALAALLMHWWAS